MTSRMSADPIVLEGRLVRLEPLTPRHVEALLPVALDQRIWEFTRGAITCRQDLEDYVAAALERQRRGEVLPFVTIERGSGAAVGSTRFALDPCNACVEIGWSWLGPRWWRAGINPEAKYLMLRHAFEEWGAVRVELKTMTRNERSRAALLRLGFVEEGVHRKRYRCVDGVSRDATLFSMLDDEWWREHAIARLYYELILDDGTFLTVYHDLTTDAWFEQRP